MIQGAYSCRKWLSLAICGRQRGVRLPEERLETDLRQGNRLFVLPFEGRARGLDGEMGRR